MDKIKFEDYELKLAYFTLYFIQKEILPYSKFYEGYIKAGYDEIPKIKEYIDIVRDTYFIPIIFNSFANMRSSIYKKIRNETFDKVFKLDYVKNVEYKQAMLLIISLDVRKVDLICESEDFKKFYTSINVINKFQL